MHKVDTVQELLGLMKKLQGERSQKQYAQVLGLSPQYLNDVYNQRREPSDRLLNAIGVTKVFCVSPETFNAARTVSVGGSSGKENSFEKVSKKAGRKERKDTR